MRYTGNREEAEDVFQEGWVRVFNNLKNFRWEGSLEGWIRKIMVNSALEYIRKKKKNIVYMDTSGIREEFHPEAPEISAHISVKELISMVNRLPEGYRMVFNLFAVEGYSHEEIAGMLGISEGTSKSQYSRARVQLQKMVQREIGV